MDWYRFDDKKIVVLGLARQGLALARFFSREGAHVVISDASPAEQLEPEIKALNGLPVELVLGGHPLTLLDGCDLLCLSGGVPMQLKIVQEAIAGGIRLSNDSLLTMQLCRRRNLGPVIAVTGSSGKTTTTTLIGKMLAASGQRVHVGGNIGSPLIDRLQAIGASEPIVLELSSFQLELYDPKIAYGPIQGMGPDIAAVLNITPNHLDRHASMTDYAQAKLNLFSSLPSGAVVVLSADDAVTAQLLDDEPGLEAVKPPAEWQLDGLLLRNRDVLRDINANIVPFSRTSMLEDGAWADEKELIFQNRQICARGEVKLRGDHNVSNVLAATAVCCAADGSFDGARSVAASFAGVPHRLEVIDSDDGVVWINDSIATSPERAVAALRCFDPKNATLILLAGGKDKNLPWQTFADETIARASMLIGFGDAGSMIVDTVQERAAATARQAPNCALVQRLDEAVDLAARAAQPGGVVLLSPGGTSYDAYRDFEARGEHFRRLVGQRSRSVGAVEIKREPSTLPEDFVEGSVEGSR